MKLTDEQLVTRQKYKEIMSILVNTPYIDGRIRFKHLKKWLCDIDFEEKKSLFRGKTPTSELYNHLEVLKQKKLIEIKKDKGKYPYYLSTTRGRFIFEKSETYNVFDNLMNEITENQIDILKDLQKIMLAFYESMIGQAKK